MTNFGLLHYQAKLKVVAEGLLPFAKTDWDFDCLVRLSEGRQAALFEPSVIYMAQSAPLETRKQFDSLYYNNPVLEEF